MIKTIFNLTKIFRTRPLYSFCSKSDILKTYLEIIPPHKIYQLREKKEHRLENALINLEQSQNELSVPMNQEDLKTIFKEVKRRTNMIPLPVLTRIAEICCKHMEGPHQIELKKTYAKIIRTVKYGAEKLGLEDMIDMVYRLVKMNKKEYELMKEVEKIIIQDKIKIDYPLIRKILYSYTHLNVGSSVLYSHISKTLTIGQNQFKPIDLAQAAYMLSKVSQNAQGGYGVFLLAQKHLEAVLPRLHFSQLTKASSFMLTQNLGSNKFQMKLEQAIYSAYPSRDRVKINDFVALLKSTSGYYFKFKEGALLSMLKSTTLRMTKFATLEQFEDIVWSWGRLGKGDKQVWQYLEKQLLKNLPSLKPRQIAFAYYSLCSSSFVSPQTLKSVEDKFMQLPLSQINQHYLVKFLLGMHRKRFYQNQKFTIVSEIISKNIEKLSNNEFVRFIKILNQSDLDFQNKKPLQNVLSSIEAVALKLQSKLYLLKLTEIAELLFLLVKFEVNNRLVEKCFLQLDTIIDIPKPAFIKSMFAFTIKQKYNKAIEFVPIIEQLTKYGPIGYFFSPHEFPLLAYCLFHLAVNGQNVRISTKLLQQSQQAVRQINPMILSQFVRKGQSQTFRLIDKYHAKKQSS